MGREENKRKKYYKSAGQKIARVRRILEPGMKGFLLTCGNNKDRDCVREAYSIFNTYADKLYSPEKIGGESDEDEDDPDVALQQEVDAIKSTKSSERRFQAVDTKCKNVIFVRTLLEHPEELLEAIITDSMENKAFSCAQICRVMPVIGTCKTNVQTIAEMAEQVLEPFFTTKAHTFAIHVKIRNNSSITRGDMLQMMGHVIKSMNPGNSVDLGKPDFVVSFDALTNVTCISVMQEYEKRCKYNLQELTCRRKMDELKKSEESGEPAKEQESENSSNVKTSEDTDDTESKDDDNVNKEPSDKPYESTALETGEGSDGKIVSDMPTQDGKSDEVHQDKTEGHVQTD